MTTMDEKLSAYLDNMLAEDERDALESLIAASPEVAARLETLALANAEFVARAATIDDVPMSGGLARQLESLRSAASGGGGNVTAFRPRPGPGRFFNDHRALAACAAVAAGFFAWQSVGPLQDLPATGGAIESGGLIIAESPLGRMFATSPSEEAVALGKGEEGRVRFSFASAEGGWCRLADVEGPDTTSRLVACQSGENWQVMIAAYTGPADGTGTDIYRTASTQAVSSVEALLDTLMDGAPLGPDKEANLIGAGWRAPSTQP